QAWVDWCIDTGNDPDGTPGFIIEDITAEKVPALLYIDDRGRRFEGPGTWPTVQEVHDFLPWSRRTFEEERDSQGVAQ
ncbi:MAG: hypothetical protein QGH25_06250, partial [Candidatus Latescibacteria bacterium]|nr:hypothetical protein [Candidatus Latescibacterota bacterium]